MREYRIFLGSSILEPISYDRFAIGNFVRKINDALRAHGEDIYLYLYLCELEDASITPGKMQKKQQEYDDFICNEADLFLNLYHERVGQFTRQELELARQFLPPENILVMFRRVAQPHTSVSELQLHLKETGLPYGSYEHIDEIKIVLLQWLCRQEPELAVCTDAGQLTIGTHTVLRTGSLH